MTGGFDTGAAAERYAACNAAALGWMLGRGLRGPGFVDTKVNPMTGADYTRADGLRGPDYTYGWIQGRALEALATHARFFEARDPGLARALDAAGRRLYRALADLLAEDGHIYFCYDRDMRPVLADQAGIVAQSRPADIWTFSDAFAAKGLVAGAARHAPAELPERLAYLDRVVEAVRAGRFQMNERAPLGEAALAAQPADFGPRMIVLGACGMLRRLGLGDHAGFGPAFLEHVLSHHLDTGTGLLLNVPGEPACNVGHGIELVGFALDDPALAADPARVETLADILRACFRAGFKGPGIVLSVSAETGEVRDPHCPWWPLPETIRAAALAHALTGRADMAEIWQAADAAFFERYWQAGRGYAYQTLVPGGPVDFVPATPDLDPGYHTGLSLLAAIGATTHTATEKDEVAHGGR
ncbi:MULTISPECIES: AGE family epimerase/isomerase [unclassified Roseitalea]|uniref:AGE family epimerase/isomerase n=1 Tax=unclassified Roseitalea TaxID=2639107 RepID=UPI00273E3A35|nr:MULTISPECIES: AGE family epimerase/isomerase [unclassified Roseitalea]